MKISTTKKTIIKSDKNDSEIPKKEVSVEKDYRDSEDSLTDWNAELNQSGRHK